MESNEEILHAESTLGEEYEADSGEETLPMADSALMEQFIGVDGEVYELHKVRPGGNTIAEVW